MSVDQSFSAQKFAIGSPREAEWREAGENEKREVVMEKG